jgi:hypothetical protein
VFTPRYPVILSVIAILSLAGGCNNSPVTPGDEKPAGGHKQRKDAQTRKPRTAVKRKSRPSLVTGYQPTHQGIYLPETMKIISLIDDSITFGPTLVIWLLDRSRSASPLVDNVTGHVRDYYLDPRTLAGDPDQDDRLLSSVVAFGKTTDYLLASPTGDGGQVATAMESIAVDASGRENGFSAVQDVIDRHLDFRTKKQREVIVIVVTDEAGDDQQQVDRLIKKLIKYAIPVYVIGTPAPLGRNAVVHPSTEAPLDFKSDGTWEPILQGPESRYSERIVLDRWGSSFGWDRVHSGFGPFAWEYLTRSTGGSYLVVKLAGYTPEMLRGPFGRTGSSLIGSYDSALMQRYTPDYVSESRYREILAQNAACHALHDAAQLGRRRILTNPVTEFAYKSEAQLNKDVTRAQLAAARLEPEINTLYEILKKGESDRARLTLPRWQAGYDLAMGRAIAAKVRIEGYNAILAVLKRGRSFEKENSTHWMLEPANTIDAGSTLKKLSGRAQTYLQRVIKDHAGTPWAKLAEQELQTPVGWKWTER